MDSKAAEPVSSLEDLTGTDVMIFKIFSPKILAKTQNKANFEKYLIITLVFKKNANFFRRK
jgi:hypothetical protein